MPLPPRRKRMRRSGRLESAGRWLETRQGKNVVRSYARWFGVDLVCAIKELRLLGVEISPEREAQVRSAVNDRQRRKQPTVARSEAAWPHDSDEVYAYCAGFTSAGFAYGVTWEEWDRIDTEPVPSLTATET